MEVTELALYKYSRLTFNEVDETEIQFHNFQYFVLMEQKKTE
jgi:hypothetical protein